MFIKICNFAINTKDIHRIPLEIYVKTGDESPEHYFGKTVFKEHLKAFLFTVEAGKDGKLFQLKLWEIGSNLHEAAGKMAVKTIDNGFESVKVSLHETLALPSSTESSVTDIEALKAKRDNLAKELVELDCLIACNS